MQTNDISLNQSLDTSLDTTLDIAHSLTLKICNHISEFPDLTPEQRELNELTINGLPVPYTPYNLLCSLIGFTFFSGESNDVIAFVTASPELSLYYWHHSDKFESLQELISAFQDLQKSK